MNRGKGNWVSSVKQLLCNAGFTDVWDNPRSINSKHFHVAYTNAIINDFENSRLLSLSTITVLCTYRLVKNDFNFSTYLD